MIQNKKYLAWAGIAVLAFTLGACNDDLEEIYVGNMDQYQKAYITTGVSYPNGSLFKLSMSYGELLEQDGKLVFNGEKKLKISSGANAETDFFFRTTFPVKTQVSGTLALSTDADKFVEQYNGERELDEETGYRLLPSEWYTLEGSHATIAAGQKEAVIRFVPNMDILWDPGKYILPLSFTLDADSPVSLSENQSSLCLVFQINPPSGEYYEGSRLLTPGEYKVIPITGSTKPTDTTYELAFDQNPDTWWDFYGDSTVEIEFNEPQYLSHISVMNCGYYFYVLAKAEGETTFKSKGFYASASNVVYTVNMKTSFGIDPSKKVDRVRIRIFYTSISDVYFLVHD
ncbi:DUF1735 domain-containing protein [uncultured Bacteroides sp.]|uniref:DUF1735 domain-containing protein n=1 Tax=uncultured Bacteroides sp. TaxID=162156 RepID=UPI002627792E|nr:DUF1735 domain-containing protein [uncultured Bacteroides sp.]